VEYFTIAHPPLFPTNSPFLLALGWGIAATWWVGLLLGLGLATAARVGSAPKLRLVDLRKSIIALLIVTGIAALLMGVVGAQLVTSGIMAVPADWDIPPSRYGVFSAVASAHLTSYVCGTLGGAVLIGVTAWRRIRT
jgi:hypothetical protein